MKNQGEKKKSPAGDILLDILGVQTRVRQNFFHQPFPDVDSGVDRHGHAFPGFGIKKSQVTSFLSIFAKTLSLEKADDLFGGQNGDAAHAGTPMQISSTWTRRSLGAILTNLRERDST